MWKPAEPIALSPDQQRILEAWVRAQKTPQSIVLRAKIVLMGASGLSNNRIAAELNTSRPTVIEWRRRSHPYQTRPWPSCLYLRRARPGYR